MNNSTTATSQSSISPLLQASLENLARNLVPLFLWVPLGLLGATTSAVVIATFFKKKPEALQTNYFLNVMHIATADLVMGVVHAAHGLRRSILLWAALGSVTTPQRCLIELGAIQASQVAAGGQVVAMAIDRLLAVAAPIWYHNRGLWRVSPINAFFWALSVVSPAIMARFVSASPMVISCSVGGVYRTMDPDYFDFQTFVQQTLVGVTIGIYVLMVLILWIKRQKNNNGLSQFSSEAARRRHANANKVAAAVVGMYLGTWALAILYNTTVNAWVDPSQQIRWIPYQPVFALLSLPSNFVLYLILDRDFRAALKMLAGKATSQVSVSHSSAIASAPQERR